MCYFHNYCSQWFGILNSKKKQICSIYKCSTEEYTIFEQEFLFDGHQASMPVSKLQSHVQVPVALVSTIRLNLIHLFAAIN